MKRLKNNGIGQRRLWLGNTTSRKVQANLIYQGDNLEIMRELEPNKIQLIYIDPPFCAGSVFKSKAWGKKIVSFNDEWGGGLKHLRGIDIFPRENRIRIVRFFVKNGLDRAFSKSLMIELVAYP